MVSANDANAFGTFLQWISPLRYLNELMFRRMLAGRPEIITEVILEKVGFTWGNTVCLSALFGFIFVCFVAGWLSLLWKTREI